MVLLKVADAVSVTNNLMSLMVRVCLLVLVSFVVHFEQVQQIIWHFNCTVGFDSDGRQPSHNFTTCNGIFTDTLLILFRKSTSHNVNLKVFTSKEFCQLFPTPHSKTMKHLETIFYAISPCL